MYLRCTIRKKDGKVHRYWRLVRGVRGGRRVIQQTVAHLGELDEQGRIEARALAHHLIGTPEQARLFDDGSRDVTVPVRLKGIRIERSRQFGDVYLALALWRGTGLAELCERLLPAGKERVAWEKMVAILVAARFCEPSSELHIAEDWYRRTALCDLLQLGDEEVNKDRLYRGLITCSRTRATSKRTCRSAAASCSQSRTKCCSTTSRAPILRARPKPIRRRSAAIPATIAPIASRC